MQFYRCFFTAAQLLALPSVHAMWTPNRETIDKILKGEPGETVHDVPDEKVHEFLCPLLSRRGGKKLVQEVTYRLRGSPKRLDIKTAVDALAEKVLPEDLVNVCVDFVLGPVIEGLDLDTTDFFGKILLLSAVS